MHLDESGWKVVGCVVALMIFIGGWIVYKWSHDEDEDA